MDLSRRAHVALYRYDRSVGVGDGLTLCDLTDESFAVFCKTDDGRSGSAAFRIRNYDRLAAFENRYARVGSTQVDTDYFTHNINPPKN